jgi:hypothetical protein
VAGSAARALLWIPAIKPAVKIGASIGARIGVDTRFVIIALP